MNQRALYNHALSVVRPRPASSLLVLALASSVQTSPSQQVRYRRFIFGIHMHLCSFDRVAMAQGKQGIWLLTFPDRENREFSKFNVLHRENCANTENFENFVFFENFVIKVATR